MIRYGSQDINGRDIRAVKKALASEWLTLGPEIEKFENGLCEIADTKYAVALNSGTAALHAAYFVAGLGPGDEVIMPPLTFIATASMAVNLGAKVIFADVLPDTGNLDPESARAAVTSKTKAIVGVDYAGHPCDYEELRKIADEFGLLFIVDCAHSINSTYEGEAVGKFADLATFSFFPTKNITTGEGGALVLNDERLAEKARAFRSHGLRVSPELLSTPWLREVSEFGMNYRLPDVLCALGSSQLIRIEKFKKARQEVFNYYSENINLSQVELPGFRPNVKPMWHLYPIRVEEDFRLNLYRHFHNFHINVQVNYLPVYWHPAFVDLGYKKGICPVAEDYYRREISLPMHTGLSRRQLSHIVNTLKAYF